MSQSAESLEDAGLCQPWSAPPWRVSVVRGRAGGQGTPDPQKQRPCCQSGPARAEALGRGRASSSRNVSSGSPVLLPTQPSKYQGPVGRGGHGGWLRSQDQAPGSRLPGFKCHHIHLLAAWPWAGNFMSLCARLPS